MFCHQCGAEIADPEDRFCSRCGAQLRREEESRDAPVATPPDSAPGPDTGPRRPVSAWPNRPRERIQLPLTELRQRRVRETGDAVPFPVPGIVPPVSRAPAPDAAAPSVATEPGLWPDAAAEAPPAPLDELFEELAIEEVEVAPSPPEQGVSTSRTRAEAALRRMVPPKEVWVRESQPGPADRGRVRDEWPTPATSDAGAIGREPTEPVPAPPAPTVEDPIIPWLDPPVLPVPPERPAPPSREALVEEGPIIVPRDYEEKADRARRSRKRVPGRAKGPIFDPAALGRSIKPSWILAIAGIILLTLIVFALFPPGGGAAGNETDRINKFTGMPIHTIATPARPVGDGENQTVASLSTRAAVPTVRAWTTAVQRPTTSSTVSASETTSVPTPTITPNSDPGLVPATPSSAPGIQVVISSAEGWSGTIGQQGETYTETPVAGRGTQSRAITGPARMVTVNIQKLGGTADLLEVRVERDGAILKQGSTKDPNGIVALSVEL